MFKKQIRGNPGSSPGLRINQKMKTIIITGASRGIGLATAKKFISEGWKVIGTYLKNKIPINSSDLISIKLDQGNPKSINQTLSEIKKLDISIDVLVNNAGIFLEQQQNTIDIKKIRETFNVNLFGLIEFTEGIMSLMKQGSHIVNIDSQYGAFSFPIDDETSTGYRLAKAALNMYTRILAFHCKKNGIIVSSLDPGWVKTDMGNSVATETEKPDRYPEDSANDIYNLIIKNKESGHFWRLGQKRKW